MYMYIVKVYKCTYIYLCIMYIDTDAFWGYTIAIRKRKDAPRGAMVRGMRYDEYSTKFYETNGGTIQAVTRDGSGRVVAVVGDLEQLRGEGESILKAAREGWPYADDFDPEQWGGLSMDEAAEEIEAAAHAPYGQERGADLIAETHPVPSAYTPRQYIESVTFYWESMGYAGKDLFKDLDILEAIAYRIQQSGEWDPADCRRLCELADMADEWDALGGDDDFEEVVGKAADKLGVDIW